MATSNFSLALCLLLAFSTLSTTPHFPVAARRLMQAPHSNTTLPHLPKVILPPIPNMPNLSLANLPPLPATINLTNLKVPAGAVPNLTNVSLPPLSGFTNLTNLTTVRLPPLPATLWPSLLTNLSLPRLNIPQLPHLPFPFAMAVRPNKHAPPSN